MALEPVAPPQEHDDELRAVAAARVPHAMDDDLRDVVGSAVAVEVAAEPVGALVGLQLGARVVVERREAPALGVVRVERASQLARRVPGIGGAGEQRAEQRETAATARHAVR